VEQLGRRREGMTLMEKAVQIDPKQPTAQANLRSALAMVQALQGEIERQRKATVANGGDGQAWRKLGIAQARLGDFAGAKQALIKAKTLLPADAELPQALQTVEKLLQKQVSR
jgi:Flp pilus assembly protein TadD